VRSADHRLDALVVQGIEVEALLPAAERAERFRALYWVDGHPAIALDGEGKPVDGAASNLGHLLETGLLTVAEEEQVAHRLAELDSGWGLRTLTSRATGYDPLSYHLGSVWPHDTAIAILGLTRAGHHELAVRLAQGLIAAALLGLDVDVPAGRITLSPQSGVGDLSVANVRIGSAAVSVQVDSDAGVSVLGTPPGLTVTTTEGH
jgi:hypothetical protein